MHECKSTQPMRDTYTDIKTVGWNHGIRTNTVTIAGICSDFLGLPKALVVVVALDLGRRCLAAQDECAEDSHCEGLASKDHCCWSQAKISSNKQKESDFLLVLYLFLLGDFRDFDLLVGGLRGFQLGRKQKTLANQRLAMHPRLRFYLTFSRVSQKFPPAFSRSVVLGGGTCYRYLTDRSTGIGSMQYQYM